MRMGWIRLSVVLALSLITYIQTDGFLPSSIYAPLTSSSAPPLDPQLLRILAQPFHYLGKGRQCFAFESEDGKMVLKFFNRNYIEDPWYSPFLTATRALKEKAKRETRRDFYLHSYEIAWRELGEEILYLHLGTSQELPSLSLKSPGGRKWKIDLNEVPFVLQKKGVLFYDALSEIYGAEGRAGLHREISGFVDQLAHRIGLNIRDGDHDVEHNWGYADGSLFHLDPGRLYREKTPLTQETLRREWWIATHNFRKWLQKKHPESVVFLDELIEKSIK